jgi:Leucine-rich repeat (LRR) protein
MATPESAWVFAWFKAAMLYLTAVTAYLGSVFGLVSAWKKLIANTGESVTVTTYAIAGVVLLPLLAAFLFNLLPSLRRRGERKFRPTIARARQTDSTYFQTNPRTEDSHRLFEHGYEGFLDWASAPRASLLYLTGPSGSGKSSLLHAYLKPNLVKSTSNAKTTLVVLRSYDDPLAALKEVLLPPALPLWKHEPSDYDKLSPLDALRRGARQLADKERLLVAFDQFEEFFLVRAQAMSEGAQETGSATAHVVPENELAPLREFFQGFLSDPPGGVTLLLSYRDDHHRLLARLGLPSRMEGINMMRVEPLDFAAAADFLRSCPGLSVPQARMDRVLREAARQEGSRAVMRPIVANLLGVVLRQMAGHPTLWKRKGDLLRGYVRDRLGRELREENAAILRAMLTDFHTARPRSAAEIAAEVGTDVEGLNARLEVFQSDALLRCLNQEASAGDRKWQIAHDFLAVLIERVLDGVYRTVWETLRPWIAPATLLLSLLVILPYLNISETSDLNLLGAGGFSWNGPNREIGVSAGKQMVLGNLDALLGIRRLRPLRLDVSGCTALTNVSGIRNLRSLQTLDLSQCTALTNVSGIRNLRSLQTLNLSRCHALTRVDEIKNLTSLQTLNLQECMALTDVDGIGQLTSLRTLELWSCTSLTKVDGLENLTFLRKLGLNSCPALTNAEVLRSLTSLEVLQLGNCDSLTNSDVLNKLMSLQTLDLWGCDRLCCVDGLKNLMSLRTLNFNGCFALTNVDGLRNLTSLRDLDLARCNRLTNLDVLKDLRSLRTLDLSQCAELTNVDVLTNLTSLEILNLEECYSLNNVDCLRNLTSLRTLSLSHCSAMTNMDGLRNLTSLRTLDLSYCFALTNVDVLANLRPLQNLDLSFCSALTNIDGLRNLTSLQRVMVNFCDRLSNESVAKLSGALPKTRIEHVRAE